MYTHLHLGATQLFISLTHQCFFSSVLIAVKCFSCMDKARCQNMVNIYGINDTHLYDRRIDQPFPVCSGNSHSPIKSCAVCKIESNISIICPGDVGTLEVEDSDGTRIINISAVCMYYIKIYIYILSHNIFLLCSVFQQ